MGVVVASVLVLGGPASVSAQVAGEPTTTVETTVPTTAPTDTVITVPESTTTTVDPAMPTTTVAPGADEIEGSYSGQPPFDPTSLVPDPLLVAAATRALSLATADLTGAAGRLALAEARLADLTSRNGTLDARTQQLVADAAVAERRFRAGAAAAYVRGDTRDLQLGVLIDPAKWSITHRYLSAIHDADLRSVDDIKAVRAGLDGETAALAAELASAQSEITTRRAERDAAATLVADSTKALAAYRAHSRAFAAGFTFPVTGAVTFDDSWGYSRMPGTLSAHWHEGTDIMSPAGTPLVACETGVIDKIDTNTLGGQSLWILGLSGTRYYYAHLSAYADGLTVGQPVTAGQVVGAVGTTGNAAGGAAHLHFEVHPGGGAPIDPYPMLTVVYVPPVLPLPGSAAPGPTPTDGSSPVVASSPGG